MSNGQQQGNLLTGEFDDVFQTAIERYGILPTTVWEHSASEVAELKRAVGDTGQSREGSLKASHQHLGGSDVYQQGASIFSPAIASWVLNCFAPPEGVVLDVFAGGGTRAMMTYAKGLRYIGTELRWAQTKENNERIAERLGHLDGISIVQGDATRLPFQDNVADFGLTCPPYWNLEEYKGGARDLSATATYDGFLRLLDRAVQESGRVLKPGALTCWVTGLHRDGGGGGRLLAMHHDLSMMHADAGMSLQEEVVIHTHSPAVSRVGMFDKGNRRLVRVHEYLMVYRNEVGR